MTFNWQATWCFAIDNRKREKSFLHEFVGILLENIQIISSLVFPDIQNSKFIITCICYESIHQLFPQKHSTNVVHSYLTKQTRNFYFVRFFKIYCDFYGDVLLCGKLTSFLPFLTVLLQFSLFFAWKKTRIAAKTQCSFDKKSFSLIFKSCFIQIQKNAIKLQFELSFNDLLLIEKIKIILLGNCGRIMNFVGVIWTDQTHSVNFLCKENAKVAAKGLKTP